MGSVPIRSASADDLVLVHPDQRPQDLAASSPPRSPSCSRASATPPGRSTSPVTSACARQLARKPLGDAQHQAAVDRRRAARAARRATTCCCSSPNGTSISRDRSWCLRQQRRDLAHLLLRGARQDRIAVKVNRAAPCSRAASSGTPRPASRCRPRAGRRRVRRCRVGMPPAPGSLPKK